jgi:hypothetical protein
VRSVLTAKKLTFTAGEGDKSCMADMLILSRVGGSAPCIVLEVYHLLPIIPTGIIVCDKQYIERDAGIPQSICAAFVS